MKAIHVTILAGMFLAAWAMTGSVRAGQEPGSGAPQLPAGQGSDGAKRLDETVARVQEAYQNLETFSAKFTQTVTSTGMSRARTDSGTVEMKRGGKMRWDFQEPEAKQFISDGQTLWFYFPAENQVMTLPLEQGASQVALDFMFGLGDVRKDFDVTLAQEIAYRKPGATALHLVPRKALGTVKRMTILVGDKDGMVEEAIVEDMMGSVTRVVFAGAVINRPIDDERFAFQAPPGVHEAVPQGN